MAGSVTHAYQSATPNNPAKEISSDRWNAAHTISGLVEDTGDTMTGTLTLPSLAATIQGYAPAVSFTPTVDSNEWYGLTMRQVIASSQISNTGLTKVRVSIKASSTSALNMTKCYIGMAASSGDAYDFASAPTQVTFNGGSAGFSAAAGVTTVSDEITFSITAGSNLIISMYTSEPSGFASKPSQTGWSLYYNGGADEAATVNVSGYFRDAGDYDLLGVVLVEATGSDDTVPYLSAADGVVTFPTLTASTLLTLNADKDVVSGPLTANVPLLASANVFTAAQTVQGNIGSPLTLDRPANQDVNFAIKNSIYTFSFTQRSSAFTRTGVAQFNLQSGQSMEIINSSAAVIAYWDAANRRMSIGNTSATVPTTFFPVTNTTTTNAVAENTRLQAVVSTASTGSAAGFGVGLTFYAETATNDTNQQQGEISTSWVTATNASRAAKMTLKAYDTAARTGFEIEASGTEPKIGFYGVTPIARAVLATGAGATVDNVITALQNLGLVKQS